MQKFRKITDDVGRQKQEQVSFYRSRTRSTEEIPQYRYVAQDWHLLYGFCQLILDKSTDHDRLLVFDHNDGAGFPI